MSAKAASNTHSLCLRLRVVESPPDVRWAVQLGRTELLAPVKQTRDFLEFEIPLELVKTTGGDLKVRGPAVQGPRGGRFLYLNSGTRAGDAMSCWDRRAKVSLESLPLELIKRLPAGVPVVLDGEIHGRAKDGGPACASVPLLGKSWTLAADTA